MVMFVIRSVLSWNLKINKAGWGVDLIRMVLGRHVFANSHHFPIYNTSNLGAVEDQDFFIWESGEKKIFLKEANRIFAKSLPCCKSNTQKPIYNKFISESKLHSLRSMLTKSNKVNILRFSPEVLSLIHIFNFDFLHR